ncbi:hypothetical protein L6452_09349 [Arctium lappa]|uniref:Uncharacterized protein n=1 Tax=Arctium lappa TaxID=4217 RepID=A0ACB9DKT5_ARCLA|nr:hypothetical protein L6452_09349 [Arctium lappa]
MSLDWGRPMSLDWGRPGFNSSTKTPGSAMGAATPIRWHTNLSTIAGDNPQQQPIGSHSTRAKTPSQARGQTLDGGWMLWKSKFGTGDRLIVYSSLVESHYLPKKPAVAECMEDEAYAAASAASVPTDDDGIEILQVYSKGISKRMLDHEVQIRFPGSSRRWRRTAVQPPLLSEILVFTMRKALPVKLDLKGC